MASRVEVSVWIRENAEIVLGGAIQIAVAAVRDRPLCGRDAIDLERTSGLDEDGFAA
jgi:hypothetical protein